MMKECEMRWGWDGMRGYGILEKVVSKWLVVHSTEKLWNEFVCLVLRSGRISGRTKVYPSQMERRSRGAE